MNKEKTIKEWLETLPDGYRERALKNHDPKTYDGTQINSLSDAIRRAFLWGGSPEGHGFWSDVWWWTLGLGELPKLPEEAE